MAVRHEVENLIRRGNIFYWRARVPASLIHCRPGSRLSLSLHCSHYRKAQIIGRKLNMRLAANERRRRFSKAAQLRFSTSTSATSLSTRVRANSQAPDEPLHLLPWSAQQTSMRQIPLLRLRSMSDHRHHL
ncbi:DUF6538 domain-containing protein [Ciceribacter selenitireducens]|uniref:DUF6538 domain-containing protein n=1 Tax=Ciceribacter selenitireducens TaxID=448181 RepID=UPI002E25A40A